MVLKLILGLLATFLCLPAFADAQFADETDMSVFETYVNPLMVGIVAWYKLDEGSGITTVDSSGFANTGLLTNTSGANPVWVAGKIGPGALSFTNSRASFVDIADSPQVSSVSGKGTISFWLNIGNVILQDEGFVSKGNVFTHAATNQFGSGGTAGGTVYGLSIGGPTVSVQSSWPGGTNNVPNNVWVWVCATWNTNTPDRRFYTNGVLCTSSGSTITLDAPTTTGNNLRIGCSAAFAGLSPGPALYLTGLIDDVKVWARDLNFGEIQLQYHDPFIGYNQ